MPQPTVNFVEGGGSQDLLCPDGQFVRGLRVGSDAGKVAALQLVCGNMRNTSLEMVGTWPAAKAVKKKGKPARERSLDVQRIECRGIASNPHDGVAATAIFGTIEGSQVQTLGLSCAREAGSMGRRASMIAAAREALDSLPRLFGWARTYDQPRGRGGRQLAGCAPGSLDEACVEASADRYCTEVQGYDRALGYHLGGFVRDSVAASGERCPRGSCRAFAAITCGFGARPAGQPVQAASDKHVTVRSGSRLVR